jgi:putative ABC transport system permease protein
MFNTRYKTREIAIRKINGATVGGIALMLNRGMLLLVGVAFVVAVPLALVFIRRWVEGYAYKAAVPWWLPVGAGLIVLLIAVATVSWQSWRAATANPVNSLKSE